MIRDTNDAVELVRSLRGDLCPACGGTKKPGHAVCRGTCWKRLSSGLRSRLYQRIGHGYEQAMRDALDVLKPRTAAGSK